MTQEDIDVYVGKLPCGCVAGARVDTGGKRELLAQDIGLMVMNGLIVERVQCTPAIRITGCQCAHTNPDSEENPVWRALSESLPEPIHAFSDGMDSGMSRVVEIKFLDGTRQRAYWRRTWHDPYTNEVLNPISNGGRIAQPITHWRPEPERTEASSGAQS